MVRLSVGLGKPSRDEADKILRENEVIRIAAKVGDFRRSTSRNNGDKKGSLPDKLLQLKGAGPVHEQV